MLRYVAVFLLVSPVILTSLDIGGLKDSDFWGPELDVSEQSDSECLKELRHLIDNEIAVPYANDLSQCRLIGIRADPCCYRQKFLAYSTAKTSELKLNQLVTRYHQEVVSQYNQVEKKRSRELGRVCPAMEPRKPKLKLIDGICTAVDELKQKWEEWRRNK